jgi:MFS family permease
MRSALAIPTFRRLAAGYTLNELGDWMATVTLAILVYDTTSSALATTALFVCAKFLPSLVVPVLAARAERAAVSRTLLGFYLVEALLFGGLALAAGDPWVPLICLLAFFDGTIAATGRAITRAATVAILEPSGKLREGNAALNIGFSSMSIAGPALAGFLVSGVGVQVVLLLTAGLFIALALVMGTTRGLPQGTTDEAPWLHRLRAGAAYVASHPIVRPLVAGQALLLVLFTMVSPIEIVYAKESLGGGDAAYGTLLTGWGAGVIIGSVIFTRVHTRPLPVLLAFSTLAIGAGYLGMAAAPTLVVATAAAVLGGIGNGMQWVVVVTAIQEAVRADMQTRVAGFFEAIATAMPGIGFVVGGVLTALLNPRVAFLVAGLGVIAIVLVGAVVWRVRRRRRDVVAVRADHGLALIEVPTAAVSTVATPEVAAAAHLPDPPRDDDDDAAAVYPSGAY